MFELVVIGANAKNILILRSNSGMEENAMKPVGVRRNQTLPCYLCVSFGSLMHVSIGRVPRKCSNMQEQVHVGDLTWTFCC